MTMPPVAILHCAPQSAPAPHEIAHAISRGPRPRSLTLAAVLPTMLAENGSS
jgi:hypothetical protein